MDVYSFLKGKITLFFHYLPFGLKLPEVVRYYREREESIEKACGSCLFRDQQRANGYKQCGTASRARLMRRVAFLPEKTREDS